jgi:hypothetical protein
VKIFVFSSLLKDKFNCVIFINYNKKMVLAKTILILEDNLKVVSKILYYLYELEQDQPYDFSVIVLTTYQQVEDYINSNPKANFDIILLDGDCKLNQSFHILDLERFGADKVITISSVKDYNEKAKKRGVKRVIEKDLANIEGFAQKVVKEIEKMIR